MRAREPDEDGFVEHDGVKIHYEVFGDGEPTVLLLPTWTIVHKRCWKSQIGMLARHFRIVSYDGPGNGRSDRPEDPAAYGHATQLEYALAVLDATATERAVVVGLSLGSAWALSLAADHPDRVLGTIHIGSGLDLVEEPEERRATRESSVPVEVLARRPSSVPLGGSDPASDWRKHRGAYVLDHQEDHLWFFFGQCFPEPHSTKQIEDCVRWGLDTTPQVLVAESQGRDGPDGAALEAACARVASPMLVIHGDDDRVSPLPGAERLAELAGGELLVVEGGGHLPLARDPVRVNLAIRGFVERITGSAARPTSRSWTRGARRRKRVLYLSSPIGLGHARRDLAVAQELRRLHPDVEVDWLAQHPVTTVLESAGETIHPASAWLTNESGHIESESGEHDLHCFQALREMDEILVSNFHVFQEITEDGHYDLVVGDESWDVDHFLHENPDLKRCAYAWLTDFVGMLPMPGGDRGPFSGSVDPDHREAIVTADVNAEMIGHIERFPYVRDRAIFVGDPEDILPERFGPDLPEIRAWTEAHYDFAGYVTGFDRQALPERAELRDRLGYRPDEQVCVVTVGGSGVGGDLLQRVVAAFPATRRAVPGLRMVVVAGPRIDPQPLPSHAGLEVVGYLPDLHHHLAASDLAVVQGGLTTCMELTATGRPFIYVPLRHHFEQHHHVAHRLRRYGAGRRLDYGEADPDHLATLIAADIGREVDYQPVATDGARRAATMLAELL